MPYLHFAFELDHLLGVYNAEVCINMDGQGRWMDNVLIERFRRSLKYEAA